MKKIVIDNIVFSLQKSGGISVVWYEILKRLLSESDINYSFIEYNNCCLNIFRKRLTISRNLIYTCSAFFLNIFRYFSLNVNSETRFIFHSSYYRLCKSANAVNVTTVHDFIYEYYGGKLSKLIHSWQKNKAIRGSDIIICISENTKNDLMQFLPDVDENKIRVIYNGVSDDYMPIKKMNIKDLPFKLNSYVLFVGSRAQYKNFDLAAQAVAKSNYNFVIVGNPLNNQEQVYLESLFQGERRYISVGRVTDKHLNLLYNGAFALLYPSLYEGFGIPVIEAQKSGCPVIAFNASSIPEIIGDTSLLINSLSIQEILNYLKLLENKENRSRIVSKGLLNAQKYSWDNMYANLMKVYNEIWNL